MSTIDEGEGTVEQAIVSRPGDGECFERRNRVVTIKGDFPQVSVNIRR